MKDWLPVIASIVVALIVNVPAYFMIRSQKKREDANAAGILTGKALDMVTRLEEQVKNLEKKVEDLEAENEAKDDKIGALEKEVLRLKRIQIALHEGAAMLELQIVDLGEEPAWALQSFNPGHAHDLYTFETYED